MILKNYYGLPKKVIFCKKTLISNQRPNSTVEFKHNKESKKETLKFDSSGISESWHYSRIKKKIDFKNREKKLLQLLEKHRGKHGQFDCIVPGSGGKDSCYAAHVLKYKYGMNPLTVTWPPILYTDYGYQNYLNWIKSCNVENIKAKRDEKTMITLTRLAIQNLFHPFQTFILGQKIFATKIALKYKIPLVFFGENEAEHGNPIADNSSSIRKSFYFASNFIFKESASNVNFVAFLINVAEEYPGIYSLKGVNAINTPIAVINKIEKNPPKTKTFNSDSFNEKRSSKLSSFKTTKRYLSVSFCLNFVFCVFFLVTKFYLMFNKYTTIFKRIYFFGVFVNTNNLMTFFSKAKSTNQTYITRTDNR